MWEVTEPDQELAELIREEQRQRVRKIKFEADLAELILSKARGAEKPIKAPPFPEDWLK